MTTQVQNPGARPVENPSVGPSSTLDKTRVPMSLPRRHLEVPDLPGYHQHWFLQSRVARALQAGYTFVDPEETDTNNFDLAGDAEASGSSDLGSRVSVPSAVGGDSDERLYLMKLPLELWEQDQAGLEARNEQVAASLRGGAVPSGAGGDQSQNYVPEALKRQMTNIFTPKRR